MLIVALLFNGPFIFAQKAAKLHHKATLADTHNDILGDVVDKQVNFSADLSATNHTDMARLKAGGMKVQVFSIFCDERYGKGTAFAKANRHMDSLMGIIKRHPDELRLVTTPNQIKQGNKKGMIACMMGVEGGHMIEDRLDYLDSLYRRGARYMTLTWNNSTSWATSAKDETEAQQRSTLDLLRDVNGEHASKRGAPQQTAG